MNGGDTLTFQELLDIDGKDLAERVPQDVVLQVCNRSLEDRSVRAIDALSLWLRKLLRAYINRVKGDGDFYNVLMRLYKWLKELVTDPALEVSSTFATLVTDALNFAKWTRENLEELDKASVHIVAYFLLVIVQSFLEQQNLNPTIDLREVLFNALDLHLLILAMLFDATTASTEVHSSVPHSIRQMGIIADLLSAQLAHKDAFLRTSQIMTHMCTHYCSCEGYQDHETEPIWLTETMLHLFDMVLNFLEIINKQEDISDAYLQALIEVIKEYLLMLLTLINTGFKHIEESVLESIFELFMSGELKQIQMYSEDVQQLFDECVRTNIMELYKLIYHKEDFQDKLIKYIEEKHSVEKKLNLCFDFVNALIMDEADISEKTCQTIQNVFEFMLKDPCQFINCTQYDRMIEAFSTLLYVLDSLPFYNYFCTRLFQENTVISHASADVLLLCFHLENANGRCDSQVITNASNDWLQCYQSYSLFSHNPSQLQVERVIKYMNANCQMEMPKQSLYKLYYLRILTPGSLKVEQLVASMSKFITIPTKTKQNYYQMISTMDLFSLHSMNDTVSLDWMPQMLKCMLSLMNNLPFVDVFFKIALRASYSIKLALLHALAKTGTISSWHFQKFLHDCKSNNNEELKLVSQNINYCSVLATIINNTNGAVTSKEYNEAEFTNYYKQLSYSGSHQHSCKKPLLKRKSTSDCSLKVLTRTILEKSQQLLVCEEPPDIEDAQQLKSAVANIIRVLKK